MRILFVHNVLAEPSATASYFKNLSKALEYFGNQVTHACLQFNRFDRSLDIRVVDSDPRSIQDLARLISAGAIIATDPALSHMLAATASEAGRYAWELPRPNADGGNEPRFCSAIPDRTYIQTALEEAYPFLDGVIVSSEFDRFTLAPYKCYYAPLTAEREDLYQPKTSFEVSPFRSGDILLRLGVSLVGLPRALAKRKVEALVALRSTLPANWHVCATTELSDRITQDHCDAAGIEVTACATDQARLAFLRGLDVYFACASWVEADLHLLECGAVGTVGIAPMSAAQPEFTPFVVQSNLELRRLLAAYAADRDLLVCHSQASLRFVERLPSFTDLAVQVMAIVTRTQGQHTAPRATPNISMTGLPAPPQHADGAFSGCLEQDRVEFADAIYQLILDREVDALGSNHISHELEKGVTRMQIVEHILSSGEFQQHLRWHERGAWIRKYLGQHGHAAAPPPQVVRGRSARTGDARKQPEKAL
jgi:hypothetical protein